MFHRSLSTYVNNLHNSDDDGIRGIAKGEYKIRILIYTASGYL